MGVLTHQVSIGLDKTALTIRAMVLVVPVSAGLYILRDEVWIQSLFFNIKPPEKARADNEHVPDKCAALTERPKPIKPITLCSSPGM